jgi:hypothetical protein
MENRHREARKPKRSSSNPTGLWGLSWILSHYRKWWGWDSEGVSFQGVSFRSLISFLGKRLTRFTYEFQSHSQCHTWRCNGGILQPWVSSGANEDMWQVKMSRWQVESSLMLGDLKLWRLETEGDSVNQVRVKWMRKEENTKDKFLASLCKTLFQALYIY